LDFRILNLFVICDLVLGISRYGHWPGGETGVRDPSPSWPSPDRLNASLSAFRQVHPFLKFS
jgi:hypothetical protein